MCGIAGLVNYGGNDGQSDRGRQMIRKMLDRISHRGPDSDGIAEFSGLALGHRRLSIIDLRSVANQPMKKGNLTIVFNGEIYNFRELRTELEKAGSIFQTDSDTEVILEQFRFEGEAAFRKLHGMFAFALYDGDSRELYLVRDQLGIKPLYFAAFGYSSLAFCSELKGFLDLPELSRELDFQSLVAAANYAWIPGERSIFKSVTKLAPGSYLKFDFKTNEKVHRTYWKLDPSRFSVEDTKQRGMDSYREGLDRILNASMDRHMIADVPISAFLSGGLDSSLICAMAAPRMKQDKLKTFTIKIADGDQKVERGGDDSHYSRVVADQFGFEHREIEVNPKLIEMLPQMVYALDEPIGDPAAINTYLICKGARELGVKVLLSGMGADELFGGYRRHLATQLSTGVPRPLKKMAGTLADLLPVKLGSSGIKLTRWAKRFSTIAQNSDPSSSYMRSYSYYDASPLVGLFTKDVSAEVDSLRLEHSRLFDEAYAYDFVNKMCKIDVEMFMVGLNLTYTDRASMAASVEVRVPYIDVDVVEYAMSIPGRYKLERGKGKKILKSVAEKYLDHSIIYRPKASFSMPIRSWISGSLKEMVDDLLSESALKRRGVFNPKNVRKLIEDDRKGYADYAYQIYELLTVELWCQKFLQ